ncbi:MAG: hypothetical protein RJB39_210 [Candidatus Parcubacteria bacterium]
MLTGDRVEPCGAHEAVITFPVEPDSDQVSGGDRLLDNGSDVKPAVWEGLGEPVRGHQGPVAFPGRTLARHLVGNNDGNGKDGERDE